MTDMAINAGVKPEDAGPMLAMTRAAERFGTTEDIADAVLLVASEKSRWITGQFISASGGMVGG
jgi:NAD(P)-dependent dehydrogenase (short-subunit alcohol dehydrogenase family)